MHDPRETAARRSLISTILQYQDMDSLLRLSAVLGNLELQGDGCSLFLRSDGSDDFELRESTVLTGFMDQPLNLELEGARGKAETIHRLLAVSGKKPEELNRTLTRNDIDDWEPDLVDCLCRFGLTRWAVQFHCPLVIERIHDDVRWSRFDQPPSHSPRDTVTKGSEPTLYHELPPEELGSIAITPLSELDSPSDRDKGRNGADLPRGVLRVVRKKPQEGFNEKDLDWLEWFAGEVNKCMTVAISLADLMDMGARLEVEDFGERLVQLLTRVLNAQGCSIFLQLEPPVEDVKTIQCIATTGLYDYKERRRVEKDEAWYEVDMKRKETDALTSWVVRHGKPIALETVHDFDPSDFEGLERQPGYGTYWEYDAKREDFKGGPLLISPLFLHQGREVTGAIRVLRSPEHSFQEHEQLLFLDISRRLSMVLTNLNVRHVSEELIELYDTPKEMIRRVPIEVCRLLGVDGCSIFLLHGGGYLKLEATKGLLEEHLKEGEPIAYDIANPDERGWTGWVARHKKALRLNTPEEATQIAPDDPPRHTVSYSTRFYEIEGPDHRFLAAPIFQSPKDPSSEVLGVLRVLRHQENRKFDEVHQSILVFFAARLSLALNIARRSETIEAVANLADLEKPTHTYTDKDPSTTIAEEVVNVMIDKMNFSSAAVYRYDDHTDVLLRCYARPTHDALIIPENLPWGGELDLHEHSIMLGDDIRLGKIFFTIQGGDEPTDRQRHLVSLLAGVCARIFFNESTFQKLESIRQGFVEIGEEVTTWVPLSQKLKTIAEVAADVTAADNVIIHTYVAPPPASDLSKGHFRESAYGGRKEPQEWRENERFTLDAVPFKVIEHGKDIFQSTARDSHILYHPKNTKGKLNFIDRESIRSAAALRLDVGNACFGCIFFNYQREHGFNARQRQEIRMMAEYAAMTVHESRLVGETQELVRETKKLAEEKQKLAEEKAALLRYADHSLAQPLNALLGYLDNLADGIYRDDLRSADLVSDEAFRKSAFIREAEQYYKLCKYITYLTDHFLRIDDAENDSLFDINPECDSNLSDVCRDAVEVAEAYMEGSIGRQIETHVSGFLDQNAIRMVVLNILINAVKYGKGREKKPIRLRLRTDCRNGTSVALIQIDDSGPGIPESDRTSIFEREYKKREPKSTGLGIGLFLARGYVEAHRGSICVTESDFGGARFQIELPLVTERTSQ